MDYSSKIACADSIIKGTIEEFLTRAEQVKAKYGTTLDRTDLPDMDYLQHLKEELVDGVLYLNKYIAMQSKQYPKTDNKTANNLQKSAPY